jgi:hypothetical protein
VNARILRIELRRTIAPWAALVCLVLALGFLYLPANPWSTRPLAWNEQWTHAAVWTRYVLVFLWPIAIGAGVIQGMRDSRSGMTELMTTMARPGLHRAAKLAFALGGLLALSFLMVFAIGAIQAVANGGFFSFAWLPIVLVGALSMFAGAWIGLGIGRVLPHPLTAPAVVVPAFAAVVLFQTVPVSEYAPLRSAPIRAGMLSPAFDFTDDPFFTTSGRVDLGQAIWLAGLAVTGLLLLAAGSRRAKVLAAVPLVVGFAVAVPVLPDWAGSNGVDPVAIEQVCDGPVCVTRMNEVELTRLAGPGKEALRLLGTLPGAPVKVVELDRKLRYDEVPPRAADTVSANLVDYPLRWSVEARDVTRELLAGAGTPTCFGELGGPAAWDERTARTIAAAWFLGDLKPLQFSGWVDRGEVGRVEQLWTTFLALPAAEQRTRIIALRQAGLTCQGSQMDILLGGTGAR